MTRSTAASRLLSLALAVGCGEAQGPPQEQAVRLVITPDFAIVCPGGAVQLNANVSGGVPGVQPAYRSSDPEALPVSVDGFVSALGGQGGFVVAFYPPDPTVADTALITVAPCDRMVLTVGPAAAELVVGDSLQLSWHVQLRLDQRVEFLTNADTVAEVTAQGLVRARGPGVAQITVRLTAEPTRRAVTLVSVRSR